MSCDKNIDLWYPFFWCMETFWPDHPEIIYSTETIENPYYKTICKNYDLDKWTRRTRETVDEIECDNVLLMVDDIFIRKKVDNNKINSLEKYINGKVAALNFHQRAKDNKDVYIDDLVSWRSYHGKYKCSLMCQLWSKEKLLDVFDWDTDPWTFENKNRHKGYAYLINTDKHNCMIDWGKSKQGYFNFGIVKGKWCRECKEFFDRYDVKINYDRRGFYD